MSVTTQRTAVTLGEHLVTWRKLLGLTAEQVAERANISRNTLRKLEKGELGVGFQPFLDVTRVLGLTERVAEALDPYETDFGRARAEQQLPRRVRR